MDGEKARQPLDFSTWKRQLQYRKRDTPLPTDRALTVWEVADKVGTSRTSIYRWMKEGEFPCSRRFGKSSVRWLESDIDAWMLSREG